MTIFSKTKSLILSALVGILLSTLMCVDTYASSRTLRYNSEIKYFDFKNNEFSAPAKSNFISWTNQHVISVHTPHHNGYDTVYKVGQPQYVEGKFQYGDFRKDLEKEWVSIYEYSLDKSPSAWKKIGRALTDSDGRIKYNVPDNMKLEVGLHLIKMYVEGDGTEANMYIQVLNTDKKYVIFDMDGTLTTSDFESVKEYSGEFFNSSYKAEMYNNANDVVKYYVAKGYEIVYLTARPYWLIEESQNWLIEKKFPRGLIHTSEGSELLLGASAATFKEEYLKQLKAQGIQFCYGYGNASSDVTAYVNAGIDKKNIFTIGKEAGICGSTAINNYSDHLKQLL
ncbi:hypothetical protein CLPUN_43590 [Clostridium puniceum]|uniref:LNS2/PITP domain-containing protein n=1 Tax=Clostridium puniceum TaxID=29367 RepID=A0A1S8T8D3_9CLOT|nr:HAD family acid phosphatase [Clostridium puniceum]OOM73725.1 hypothetical protein CLPUN_43590 [Clostridium puniceum]